MARPQKKGLNYFPLECGIFSANSDLKPLIRRFGAEGFAIAIHIYCDVYANGYFLKPNDLTDYYYELADDCKVTVEKVQLVIAFMKGRTLLDTFNLDKNTVITSHGIQKRYAEAMKTRKQTVAQYKGDFWLLSEEEEKELENDTSCKSAKNENYSEKNPSNSEIYTTNKIKENEITLSKKESNKDKDIVVEGRQSYDDIISEWGFDSIHDDIIEFIRHCNVNGKTVINSKLESILYRLCEIKTDEERRQELKNAINGGYFDIKKKSIFGI